MTTSFYLMNTVNWKKNDTLVISDVHIGIRNNQVKKLCNFLNLVLENPPKRVVVNGDLFELWSANYKSMDIYDYKVIRRLIKLSEIGIKLVFIPGNHDWAFRAFKTIHIGKIKILNEYAIDDYKKKYVVLHGDEFDAFTRNNIVLSLLIDKLYLLLIKATAFLKRLFRMNFALYARNHSEKYKKQVARIKKAALKYAHSAKVDGIIIGHTHWPEIFIDIDGVIYANSGDWLDNCSYLVVGEEIKLHYYN